MTENNSNYGLLINQQAKIHRQYFKEMVKLLGIFCIYRAPRETKEFDLHGDLETAYYEPIKVGCIFDEHPTQKSLKKMGWVAELQEGSSLISVPYDLPHLEVGALFTIPGGLDDSKGRVFRVISLQNIMIYPASITCEIAPEYETTDEKRLTRDFTQSDFTVLKDNEEDD